MAENKRIDEPTGTQTVGHEWDGIEELNTPLPRWWLLTFYACILWAIGYVIFFPAIPLLHDATKGISGWTSQGQLETALSAEAKRRAPITAAIAATPIEQLPANDKLMQAAIEGGRAAFKVHCVQCERRVVAEAGDQIDHAQRGQYRHPVGAGIDRPVVPLAQAAHRGIVIDRDDQAGPERTGLREVGDVSAMQQVEDTIGEYPRGGQARRRETQIGGRDDLALERRHAVAAGRQAAAVGAGRRTHGLSCR